MSGYTLTVLGIWGVRLDDVDESRVPIRIEIDDYLPLRIFHSRANTFDWIRQALRGTLRDEWN